MAMNNRTNRSQGVELSRMISPGQHAMLDYLVAGMFFMKGAALRDRHPRASALAYANGAMVAGMSMMTDYPGGLMKAISFHGHRTGDIIQAAFAALGPALFGFPRDPEANYFYAQAASEVGVIATTDWDAA